MRGLSTESGELVSAPFAPVHMAWSKATASCVNGSGTSAPSPTEALTTLGALTGAISSMRLLCATSTRPSGVASSASPRVPPCASCSTRREASSTIQTALVCGNALPVVPPVGRCGRLLLASSRPCRPLPAWPKAMLSTRPASRYSSSARPAVRPLIGKLTISVVAAGSALAICEPLQRTPHSRPSGPKARSPTRVLENARQAREASVARGSNTATPSPVLT